MGNCTCTIGEKLRELSNVYSDPKKRDEVLGQLNEMIFCHPEKELLKILVSEAATGKNQVKFATFLPPDLEKQGIKFTRENSLNIIAEW